MGTFGLVLILSWLMGSALGRLLLAAAVLWYLDNRYLGFLAGLMAPVLRAQRVAGLRRTVELNPADVRAMVELGEHYLKAGRPQIAADYLERAVARGEDGARALYLLGAALVKVRRYPEGRVRLEAALAATPMIAFGDPYLYLLEETLATEGATSPRVAELVGALDPFDSVEVLTRAGRLCGAAGRRDLAVRLLREAVEHYGYTPKAMRRRERRWLVRARLGLLQFGR